MLENRSFDHMLGFSGITGIDATSGAPTAINGLTGSESNNFNGQTYQVKQPADYAMPADPGHEFSDVLEQLCGQGAVHLLEDVRIQTSSTADLWLPTLPAGTE